MKTKHKPQESSYHPMPAYRRKRQEVHRKRQKGNFYDSARLISAPDAPPSAGWGWFFIGIFLGIFGLGIAVATDKKDGRIKKVLGGFLIQAGIGLLLLYWNF